VQRNKVQQSAMRMAQRKGVDPYNSAMQQGQCYATLVRLQIGRVKSESDANRLMGNKGKY
jgi:hypothetical protein